MLPSGSVNIANEPMSGIGVGGTIGFDPSLAALSSYYWRSSTST